MTAEHTQLIRRVTDILEEDERVLAAWLEGSIARGEEDEYSDIDLWVAVRDKAFDEFIEQREQFAAQLGPVVSILYPKTPNQPDYLDSFKILLEDASATVTIDVDVQKESRPIRFTKDSVAEECKVLFDKVRVIRWKPFNPQAIEEYATAVFGDTATRFWHRIPQVQKFFVRDDILEAVDRYMECLEYLVIIYRILYIPEKVDWGFKDIEYDLPEDTVHTLYALMPYPEKKALQKLTAKLAKTFAKQSSIVGKRIKHDAPQYLAKHVMKQLH